MFGFVSVVVFVSVSLETFVSLGLPNLAVYMKGKVYMCKSPYLQYLQSLFTGLVCLFALTAFFDEY